ncbi:hypothetical protein HQ489_00830 [Candidatus Woesearchaeota archaeon]|nr:hypothetical protein [Candidatus Woesearchaeota archaeon]
MGVMETVGDSNSKYLDALHRHTEESQSSRWNNYREIPLLNLRNDNSLTTRITVSLINRCVNSDYIKNARYLMIGYARRGFHDAENVLVFNPSDFETVRIPFAQPIPDLDVYAPTFQAVQEMGEERPLVTPRGEHYIDIPVLKRWFWGAYSTNIGDFWEQFNDSSPKNHAEDNHISFYTRRSDGRVAWMHFPVSSESSIEEKVGRI